MEQLPVRNSVQSEFLHRVRVLRLALFTQLHDEVRDRNVAAADFLASSALQADALDLLRSLFGDEEVAKKRSDTAGVDLGAVNVSAHQREGGTYVKTCAAADAVEDLAEVLVLQDRAASRVVQDHCVEFLLCLCVVFLVRDHLGGTGVHGNVGSDPLTRAVSRKGLEDRSRVLKGLDELLDTEDIEMDLRQGAHHAAVAFVGHREHGSRLGDRDVRAGDTHVRVNETVSHDASRGLHFFGNDGFILHLGVVREEIRHLLLVQMQRRHDHVDRRISLEGDDEFAEVRLLDQDAVVSQDLVEMDLLGSHGFGLHDGLDALFLHQVPDPLHRLFRAAGVEHDAAALFTVGGEFFDHLVDMIRGIGLDFPDLLPDLLKIDTRV